MKANLRAHLQRLQRHLGPAGIGALALLAAAVLFSNLVLGPLEERNLSAQAAAARQAPKAGDAGSGAKVAEVYQFLGKTEQTTDWLAKLHGIGAATGVRLKSAAYKTQQTDSRIVRTEIVLPVSGSYTQIRDFMQRALAEIPVLSVDSISIKRTEQTLHAELKLTLHMVKS